MSIKIPKDIKCFADDPPVMGTWIRLYRHHEKQDKIIPFEQITKRRVGPYEEGNAQILTYHEDEKVPERYFIPRKELKDYYWKKVRGGHLLERIFGSGGFYVPHYYLGFALIVGVAWSLWYYWPDLMELFN